MLCAASPQKQRYRGLEWMDQVLPATTVRKPGSLQRCVRCNDQAQYPNTVLGGSMPVGDPRTNYGYISEAGFWDGLVQKTRSRTNRPAILFCRERLYDIPEFLQSARRAVRDGSMRGSRWLDVVKVENSQMTHMCDMKFPGDKVSE